MHNLNNNKNNTIVTSVMLLSLATMIIIADLTTPLTALGSRSREEGFIDPTAISELNDQRHLLYLEI
jgi:hypothetical protein